MTRVHDCTVFRDRADAGRRLASTVRDRVAPDANIVVLGLPRGGVPVAAEVARALHAPLDIIVVRKIGVPRQPELAMGALGEDGIVIVNDAVVQAARVSPEEFDEVLRRERNELERRVAAWRPKRKRVPMPGRTALIVDDGIATGATVRAACEVARAHGATRVIVGAPVAPASTIAELLTIADDVIVADIPERFLAIGEFYNDFTQTNDAHVAELLTATR